MDTSLDELHSKRSSGISYEDKLKSEMYPWTQDHCKDEWKEDWNDEKFLYKLRKKVIGRFEEQLWHLFPEEKTSIYEAFSARIGFFLNAFNLENTQHLVAKYN